MNTPRTKRHVLSKRARTVVRVIAMAVALGAVITLVGVVAQLMRPLPVRELAPAAAVAGQADYEAGLAALASGDTTKAVGLLTKAAAAGNAAAKVKLNTYSQSSSPAASTSTSTGTLAPTPSDVYMASTTSIDAFLPKGIAGYAISGVETGTASAILSAEPSAGGPQGVVQSVVITVLYKKTVSAGVAWMKRFPIAYPKNLSEETVGDEPGRFGTDGSHLAAFAFARGLYGFEVVATAVRGNPANLKSQVLQAAASLAATRVNQ